MPVMPTQEQIAELAALTGTDADAPLVMLNLNTYRPAAAYDGPPPGGGSPDVTGREAYERYAEVAQRVLAREGGRIVWHAAALGTVIGEPDEGCDEVIAVYYPSVTAFLALAMDPELLEAATHRTAGLERARLIRCDAEDVSG